MSYTQNKYSLKRTIKNNYEEQILFATPYDHIRVQNKKISREKEEETKNES